MWPTMVGPLLRSMAAEVLQPSTKPTRSTSATDRLILRAASIFATLAQPSFATVFGYAQRWRIEDFHRTWKSGTCRVEKGTGPQGPGQDSHDLLAARGSVDCSTSTTGRRRERRRSNMAPDGKAKARTSHLRFPRRLATKHCALRSPPHLRSTFRCVTGSTDLRKDRCRPFPSTARTRAHRRERPSSQSGSTSF